MGYPCLRILWLSLLKMHQDSQANTHHITQNEQTQAERKTQYMKLNNQFEPMKEEFDRKTKEMQKTSELLQALTTGVSAQEGQENGYLEQLQGKRLSDSTE